MHLVTPMSYTLSLHDALPIFGCGHFQGHRHVVRSTKAAVAGADPQRHRRARIGCLPLDADRDPFGNVGQQRSEEHTSELQSLRHLVCRLLLEKKKTKTTDPLN